MAKIRDLLDSIEQDIRAVRPEGAQQRLQGLVSSLGPVELQQWQAEIERIVGMFLPKRKKALEQNLQERLKDLKLVPTIEEKTERVDVISVEAEPSRTALLENDLNDLAQFHIFQWSTHYREWAERFLAAQLRTDCGLRTTDVRVLIGGHVTEIFERGFRFKTQEQGKAESLAHLTAVNGLQRFSELAVEFYSASAMKLRRKEERQALRTCVSAYLGAALSGFARAQFGGRSGAQLLAAHRIQWLHYLPFMTLQDVSFFGESLGAGSTGELIFELGRPLASALDSASAYHDSYLPQISQYYHDQRKLEIVLNSPRASEKTAQVEIFALLDAEFAHVIHLKEADSRDVRLVICALKADVASAPIAERIQAVLVNVREPGYSAQQIERRAKSVLMDALSRLRPDSNPNALLEYNFARNFPLSNPFQSKYFHVVRGSVRNLLRELEGGNGVKLWCSVRRSGKTTACFDLSGALPSSDVVVQTCDTTRVDDLSRRFFDSIIEHLESSRPLPKSFVRDIVEELRPGGSPKARVVVILDEYETLFGRMRAAARSDDDLKYTVIYPLLGQMVAFARENMLVFVGQQPNAHFILMEQNPLSAYVKQDSFPLFSRHGNSRADEFTDLVAKVLTDRYDCTNRFLDKLFSETGGHPFLTVNVLVNYVDWLIDKGTKRKDVRFNEELWDQFSLSELSSERIPLSTEFQFFLEAAADAMSYSGFKSSPWLWAVYRSLREFVRRFGPGSVVQPAEFLEMYRFNDFSRCGISGEEVIRTASDTNFFCLNSEGLISVRIPILARIAASATPRVN